MPVDVCNLAQQNHTPDRGNVSGAIGLLALDPGDTSSALIEWDGERPSLLLYESNQNILDALRYWGGSNIPLVIEKIASYGMAVGATVFETCFWSGRFAEAYSAGPVHRITRGDIKLHLCHSMRAKDANVRQAIIDRFGGKDLAIGRKAAPGPLYGVSGDLWAALAVGITWHDLNGGRHV